MKKFKTVLLSSMIAFAGAAIAYDSNITENNAPHLSKAPLFDNSKSNLSRETVYALTDRAGTFMSEVQSRGIQFSDYDLLSGNNSGTQLKSSIVYAEVAQLIETYGESVALEMVNNALEGGHKVILETENYDIRALSEFVQFISYELADFKTSDVMVSLIQDKNGNISTGPVKLTKLMLDLGVPYEETSEYKIRMAEPEYQSSKSSPQSFINLHLGPPELLNALHKIAVETYNDNPMNIFYSGSDFDSWGDEPIANGGTIRLVKNYTQLDIWTYQPLTGTRPESCIVGWRGTNTSDPRDIFEDISSQVRTTIQLTGAPNGVKGAQGFVRRINELSEFVNDDLIDIGCSTVHVTGHSLGAALSQIYGYSLMINPNFQVANIHVFNSPNFANTSMRNDFLARKGQQPDVELHIFNRRNDGIVNPVPTGLRRFGFTQASLSDPLAIRDVTYQGGTMQRFNPFGNHDLASWVDLVHGR